MEDPNQKVVEETTDTELLAQEAPPRANRAIRRLLRSDRFRRKNGLAPVGDDPENPAPYREPRGKSMVNSLKRRRRDARIRAGLRESRGGEDAKYDEKRDSIIFCHPTKGKRKMSRKRFEARARETVLLRPTADDGARV